MDSKPMQIEHKINSISNFDLNCTEWELRYQLVLCFTVIKTQAYMELQEMQL